MCHVTNISGSSRIMSHGIWNSSRLMCDMNHEHVTYDSAYTHVTYAFILNHVTHVTHWFILNHVTHVTHWFIPNHVTHVTHPHHESFICPPESCHTRKHVNPHDLIKHLAYTHIMSHICMSHVTRMNASCDTYERSIPPTTRASSVLPA